MTRLSIEIAVGILCGPEESLTKETPITRSSFCSHGDKIGGEPDICFPEHLDSCPLPA
jgi:hypothetical protein